MTEIDKILAWPVDTLIDLVNTHLPGPVLGPILVNWETLIRSVLPVDVEGFLDKFLATSGSVHVKKLPLMNPFHVLFIIVVYLSVIFTGQFIMSFLPKFQVKLFAILHNLILVLLSGYMMIEIVHQAYLGGYSLWGNPQDETEKGWPMAKIIWLFYVSKITEFTDTLIMVLKKNNHQISFLHVYHHWSIFAIWWLVTFMAPGGEAYYSAALNSFIHVIMYSYYLSKALGIDAVDFIKHYITMMQMTQFLTMLLQSVYDMITGGGGYPALTTRILFFYMISMLVLFNNFLQQDKAKKKRERELAKAANAQATTTTTTTTDTTKSPVVANKKSKKDN